MARNAMVLLSGDVKDYSSFTLPLAEEGPGYVVDEDGYLTVNSLDGTSCFPPSAWRGVITGEGGES